MYEGLSVTDLTGAPGDGDPVGAATVLVGVTGASPVVGPLGRGELIRAAAVIRRLNFIYFCDATCFN